MRPRSFAWLSSSCAGRIYLEQQILGRFLYRAGNPYGFRKNFPASSSAPQLCVGIAQAVKRNRILVRSSFNNVVAALSSP